MINIEEFVDLHTEGSFAVRDAEVQFKLAIGRLFKDVEDEKVLKMYAQAIKKHVSYLKECKAVAKKWDELEKTYTKNKSWSDLVKEAGFEKEKRPRKALRKVIEERMKMNQSIYEQRPDNTYAKGRLDEDKELLEGDLK